jgi:cell division protein FtsW (lipid II flippase)
VSGGILYMMRNSYQKSRFDHFVNLLLGRGEPGWQVKQSLISISQGGWFGKGLGNSQQKYNFLPEAHKDFIFAVIGEELGLTGSVGVLIIFFIIIYRGIRIAQRAPNGYGQLLAGGITACIGLYALINAGVAVAILPTTGLPMPFLSYGGSALVTHLVAIGLLINISIQGSNSYINQVDWPVYNKRLNRRKL